MGSVRRGLGSGFGGRVGGDIGGTLVRAGRGGGDSGGADGSNFIGECGSRGEETLSEAGRS